ncbi:hypothetical protein HDV00_001515 [Rhizophlyctis rosea]|nr:hypothetical protein HDV00_001515 [Rhizophlyctis rosea]
MTRAVRQFFVDQTYRMLEKAARQKDIEMADFLLGNVVDINGGEGPILTATVQSGDIGLVTQILDRGADVNAVVVSTFSLWRTTALHEAVSWGFTDVVKLLVERGADPNIGNFREEKTPLYWAVLKGDAIMVQCLLDAGADILQKSRQSLMYAVQYGFTKIVKAVVEAGADVWGTEALIEAIRQGHLSMVPILLDAPANVAFNDGEAMLLAASAGYTDIVRELLEGPPNEQDGDWFREFMVGVDRVLGVAAADRHHEIVKLLLKAGGSRYDVLFKAGHELGK